MRHIRYENRLVAFIDLLGFKNTVNNSLTSDNIRLDILHALKQNERLYNENYGEGLLNGSNSGIEVMFFSDSFVISYPENYPGALALLLLELIWQAFDIANNNFLVRGGVTYGQLYHKGNICFGPAMNAAYELESKYAKYPRIIVDDVVMNMITNFKLPYNSKEFEENFIKNLVKKDPKDNKLFLDYLSQRSECDSTQIYYDVLKKIKNNIEKNLEKYGDKILESYRIREKYQWYKDYFNDVIMRVMTDEGQKEYLIR